MTTLTTLEENLECLKQLMDSVRTSIGKLLPEAKVSCAIKAAYELLEEGDLGEPEFRDLDKAKRDILIFLKAVEKREAKISDQVTALDGLLYYTYALHSSLCVDGSKIFEPSLASRHVSRGTLDGLSFGFEGLHSTHSKREIRDFVSALNFCLGYYTASQAARAYSEET